jgi:hypothetical protein
MSFCKHAKESLQIIRQLITKGNSDEFADFLLSETKSKTHPFQAVLQRDAKNPTNQTVWMLIACGELVGFVCFPLSFFLHTYTGL